MRRSVFGGVSGDMIGATNEAGEGSYAYFVCRRVDADMKVPALIMAGGKGKPHGVAS